MCHRAASIVFSFALFAAALSVLAPPANAATLSITSGLLELRIGPLPVISVAQSGAPAAVSVSSVGGSFSEPAGVFAESAFAVPTSLLTGVPLISSLRGSLANGVGAFAAGGGPGGGFGGAGALTGVLSIDGGGIITPVLPLAVLGGGGVTTLAAAALAIALTGAEWTTGAAVVTGVTTGAPGSYVNTMTLSGVDARTAAHQGHLVLVTPARLLTNVIGNVPVFAIQTLVFVPEPGSALLLGGGALALAFALTRGVGRARRRR